MGGLRRFMPITAFLMLLGTLAISGVFPLSGFFSKDLILAETFARAHGSPLASASLFGIPGSTLLYVIYGMGVLTALLTAYYMTRLLVLAFYGANRTGAKEQEALHEAPSVMTLPLIVLGVLTVIGGWLNLPALIPIGPTDLLTNWLEPVTGASSTALSGGAHLSHGTELVLVAVATAAAVLGIVVGVLMHRAPIADKPNSAAEQGVRGLLYNAYGVDTVLDRWVVRPLGGFAKFVLGQGVERGIDRFFTGGGSLVARFAGKVGERLQDGDVGKYAWMVTGGVLALIAILLFTT
jgi:NADH-quinone oxidoreductase subunit L